MSKTMIDYVAEMPEKLHRPKEENFLPKRLRARAPEAAPVLDRLVTEHRDSMHAVERMSRALVRCRVFSVQPRRQAYQSELRSVR